MSYANRPMGDYKTYGYAGDPGFLSSLWRGIKKVAPAIIGGMLGGPAGALIGAAGSVGSPATPPMFPQPQAFFPRPTPGSPVEVGVSFPGGTRVAGRIGPFSPFTGATRGGYSPGPQGGCPTGYHLRKDPRLPPKCVRNRRMNVANPRALRRGMRRVQGFEKLAKRTIQFTRRVKMKKRSSS